MVAQDTRYAARSLLRRPGFACLATLTLTLGLSLNVTVFAVLQEIVIRALPYRDPERIVLLSIGIPKKGIEKDWTSYPTLMDWKRASRTLEEFAIHLRLETATVSGDEPARVRVGRVSANLFPLLGIKPIRGRTYTTAEEERREPVAVISHGYWLRQFGGSDDVLGKTLPLDNRAATIVGVMPASFAFPSEATDIWIPLTYIRQWPAFLEARQSDGFRAVARLKPGVSLEQARADLAAVAADLAVKYPETDANKTINVTPIAEEVTQPGVHRALWLLMAAVTLVLLVACANVTSLFLARGNATHGEVAVRVALGASRRRVMQLKLAEAMLVSLVAGVLSLGLSAASLRIVTLYLPADLPRVHMLRIDPAAALFTFVVSVICAVLAGVASAWSTSRADPIGAIRGATRGLRGQSRPFGRRLLVSAQFALTTLLTVSAALLILSYWELQRVDIGLQSGNVLLAPIELPGWFEGTRQNAPAYFEDIIKAVDEVPGVESAAAISSVFSSYVSNNRITIEGRPSQAITNDSEPNVNSKVAGDYFGTMKIPLLRGRSFNEHDGLNAPRAAVINRTMANRFWPNEDPIGKRFRFGLPGQKPEAWVTVIGLVADTLPNGPESRLISHFYLPLRQNPWFGSMEVVARTKSVNPQLTDSLRRAIRSVDRSLPSFDVTTVDEKLAQMGARRKANTLLLGLFSALSITLASVGLYALIHYSVIQRTSEIGVRIALGARPQRVVVMVVGEGIALASCGMAIGLAGSIVLMRILSSFLHGVQASDLSTFGGVTALLLLIAVAACGVPAANAARINPARALNSD